MTYFPRATLIMGAPGILLAWMLEMESSDTGMSNIPNPSFEITIVCSHNIDTMLDETIHQTIISICSLVVTFDSLKPGVFGYTQSKPVFWAKLLKFCQYAIGHDGDTFRIEAIHHGWNDLKFVLDGMGNKIGVHQY